jgi:hypothetical protein
MCLDTLVPDECAAIFTRPEDGSVPCSCANQTVVRQLTTKDYLEGARAAFPLQAAEKNAASQLLSA